MTQDDNLTCADCGAKNPSMHNSREIQTWSGKTAFKRFPGYLCIECWKAANPVLWPKAYEPKTKVDSGDWIVTLAWLILAILLVRYLLKA